MKAVDEAHAAAAIIGAATAGAGAAGIRVLSGAYCQVYAGLVYDFVKQARQWIGPHVRMPDGSVVTMEEMLAEHCFGTLFKPLFEGMSRGYMYEIKRHFLPMIAERPQSTDAQTSGGVVKTP